MTVRGPTKAVSVEDSFKSCDSWQGVERVLAVLTPDLLARLHEEAHVGSVLTERAALAFILERAL